MNAGAISNLLSTLEMLLKDGRVNEDFLKDVIRSAFLLVDGEFPVTIDPESSFPMRVAEAKFARLYAGSMEDFIRLRSKNINKHSRLKVVRLDENLEDLDAAHQQLEALNLRSANLDQLVAFTTRYPHIVFKRNVACVDKHNDEGCVAVVTADSEGRWLNLIPFDEVVSCRNCVLAEVL